LICASNAPDLDFLPGLLVGELTRFHRGPSHSLLASGLVGLTVAWIARRANWGSPRRLGYLSGLAVATHLVLDMLSSDDGIRHGVELFWPILNDGVALPPALFVDLIYNPEAPNVILGVLHGYNARALAREWVIVAVVVLAGIVVRSVLRALFPHRAGRGAQSSMGRSETDATD
jgi:membrane-bound metal-dependent hydrolase YbcI (DUF457 family)